MSAMSWIGRFAPRVSRRAGPAIALVSLLSLGCGVYQAGVRTGPLAAERIPPTDPGRVRIFGGENANLAAQEIGFVVGVADADQEALALQRVRQAAAALGADGLLDLRFEIHQDQLVARARAVRLASPAGGQ